MKSPDTSGKLKISRVLLQVPLILIGLLTVIPFILMLNISTYETNDVYKQLPILPGSYLLENFKTVMSTNFLVFFKNSFFVSAVSICITLLFSSIAGFAFAKYTFKGRNALFIIVLATMMLPPQLGLIAYIWEMRIIKLNQTLIPLILPWISNTFGVFWMTQYIKSAVPDEIIDSARVDTGNDINVFFRIVLPIIKPGVMSLGLMCFIWAWNDFLLPMVMITKKELFTIPLGMATFSNMYKVNYSAQILALTISLTPVFVLFFAGSKQLISGLTAGAVKG